MGSGVLLVEERVEAESESGARGHEAGQTEDGPQNSLAQIGVSNDKGCRNTGFVGHQRSRAMVR